MLAKIIDGLAILTYGAMILTGVLTFSALMTSFDTLVLKGGLNVLFGAETNAWGQLKVTLGIAVGFSIVTGLFFWARSRIKARDLMDVKHDL